MSADRQERLKRLEARVQAGEVDAWKVALLREWAAVAPNDRDEPTLEDLTELLTDPKVMTRLKRLVGPWDALTGQAGSHRIHREVGSALVLLAEAQES